MPRNGTDRTLAFCLLCLLVLGIIFVYSSSYYRALRNGEDATYYMLGHVKRVIVASFFFLLGLIIPYEKVRRFIFPLFVVIVVILVMTLILGRFAYGARRSLPIFSVGLQVSEFVKVWIVFFLANFFSSHPKTANTGKGILIALAICFFIILLVAVQPSISMALICLIMLGLMLVYGGAKMRLFVPTIALSVGLLIILILFFPHAQDRVTRFITNPAYQVQQSLIAIGSGGLIGKGPGAGLQKFLFLPRIHNDFIFAHIAEELGFVGSLLVFVFYWQIYLRGILIARSLDDEFARFVVLGLNATIFVIFLIHVGVSIGLVPPTGIPLPFISFGGWSLSANLYSMGVILQVSKWRIT